MFLDELVVVGVVVVCVMDGIGLFFVCVGFFCIGEFFDVLMLLIIFCGKKKLVR